MKKKLIFFVDDDNIMLNAMEYVFKARNDCEVLSFQKGEDCLKNIHLNPDIVILDYHLGKDESSLNGLQVLRKIKEVNKNIDVIMLTIEKNPQIIDSLYQEGISNYIVKDSYFITTLGEILDNYKT